MENTKIGIFLGKDKIQVSSIDFRKECRLIGFGGDTTYFYKNETDIDDCITSLEDTYNVENLSELDYEIYVLDCGTNNKLKYYFLNKIEQCRKVSLLYITDLLYIIAMSNNWLQSGIAIGLDFLDANIYVCNNMNRFVETDVTPPQNKVTIYDIMNVLLFDFYEIQQRNTSIIEKYKAEKEKWDKEKKQIIKELREDYEKKIIKIINEYERKEAKRVNAVLVKKRKLVYISYKDGNEKLDIYKPTGDNVYENDLIACVINKMINPMKFNNKLYEVKTNMRANYSGIIAWLFPNMTKIGSCIINANVSHIPVAVIGENNDNIESMIEWGKQQAGVEFKKF